MVYMKVKILNCVFMPEYQGGTSVDAKDAVIKLKVRHSAVVAATLVPTTRHKEY